MSIVIVTGVPGVGKSTICKAAEERNTSWEVINFGKFLAEHLQYERKEKGCDEAFANYVMKKEKNAIIDSHGVEKLEYGLKFVPFDDNLKEHVGAYVLIEAKENMILKRRLKDAKKRVNEDEYEIRKHQQLLEIELISNANIFGRPAYIIHNNSGKEDAVNKLERILDELQKSNI